MKIFLKNFISLNSSANIRRINLTTKQYNKIIQNIFILYMIYYIYYILYTLYCILCNYFSLYPLYYILYTRYGIILINLIYYIPDKVYIVYYIPLENNLHIFYSMLAPSIYLLYICSTSHK